MGKNDQAFLGNAAIVVGIAALACLLYWLMRGRPEPVRREGLWVNRYDAIETSQLWEGVYISGATGSGKSSGPGAELARMLLAQGAGVLALCAKRTDAEDWWRWCEETGRTGDYLRFAPDMPWRFDWLTHELSSPGGSIETAANLLQTLVEATARSSGKGDEAFWQMACERHLRNSIACVWLAWGKCSARDVYSFVTSAPTERGEINTAEWQGSFSGQTLLRLKHLAGAIPDGEGEILGAYWISEYVGLSEKTRSIVYTMCVNILSKFLSGPVAGLVSPPDDEHPALDPDAVMAGKVVVIDFPTLVHRDPGRLLQIVWKVLTQRSVLRRKQHDIPVVIFSDEAHLLALPQIDAEVAAVARSHRLIQINIVQNLPLLYASLGSGDKGRQEGEAWIANLQTKVLCQNSCSNTNQHFSELIGQRREVFISGSQSTGPYDLVSDTLGIEEPRGSAGFSEQLAPELMPREFNKLAKGGVQNDRIVEAILFQGGRRFANGKSWTRAYFRQGNQ